MNFSTFAHQIFSMSFSISRSIQNGLDLVVLTDKNAETEIAVLPSFGALLHAFKVKLDDELLNIIDNYKNYEEAEKFIGINFKSPKLSPFPCRIPDGKYTIADNEFEFVNKFMDGSAIHGYYIKNHLKWLMNMLMIKWLHWF